MQFDKQKFALAATGASGIAYVICAVFTAIAPDLAVRFLGWMMHILNVEKFVGEVETTFGSVILGLIPILIYSYIIAWVFAWLYNKLVNSAAK